MTNPMHSCGKSKVMYLNKERNTIEMHFLDSVSSYTQQKHERIKGTGNERARFSSEIFKYLQSKGIQTHFIQQLSEGQLEVDILEMFKLEIIPRNFAAGSIVRNYPVQHGQKFESPLLKIDMKYNDDPMLNEDYILGLGLATKTEIEKIYEVAYKLNDILYDYFYEKGLFLVDFKFEVGKNAEGEIVIGDEISPDGMRLWDINTKESLDKDLFRYNLGDLLEGYQTVTNRIKGE